MDFNRNKMLKDLATLHKNRTCVPLDVLETKYKEPWNKKCKQIAENFNIDLKNMMRLTNVPQILQADAESKKNAIDSIQKIVDEEKTSGHFKMITDALFEKCDLTEAENLACGFLIDRIYYEVYAPFWLKKIRITSNRTFMSDLLPGMVWVENAGIWWSESDHAFTIMLPPTEDAVTKEYDLKKKQFAKYLEQISK